MHSIKKSILRVAVAVAMVFSAATFAEAQVVKGEKSVGPKLGYVSKNESASAGLFFQYAFSEHFRIAPEIGYTFRHKDMDAFTFDINAHIPFGFTGEKVAFYPLAGLNYSSWNTHFIPQDMIEGDDVSSRTSRFGLNMGAGFELRCSATLKLTLEAKYCLIKDYSSAMIAAGISFVF